MKQQILWVVELKGRDWDDKWSFYDALTTRSRARDCASEWKNTRYMTRVLKYIRSE